MQTTDSIELHPTRGLILIAWRPTPNRTAGGLHLTGGIDKIQIFAEVLRVGLPLESADGGTSEADFEVGDIVMLPRPGNPRTGEPLDNEPWIRAENEAKVMIVPQEQIIATVKNYVHPDKPSLLTDHSTPARESGGE